MVLSGSVCDYDDIMTINRNVLTMMIWMTLIVTLVYTALLGRIIISHDLHGPDDCGVYCVSRGDVDVMPYWSEDEEGDVYEGDVALPRTGSNEPVNSVVSTSGPGGPTWPGWPL